MASSHDGTCPRNLLQGLVAGTSPLVCADLNRRRRPKDYCAVNYTYRGSHDAWVFRLMAPIASDILDKINYAQNKMGIEQVLIFYFKTSEGFTVKNPCRILKIVHHHCSDTSVKKDRYINGRRVDVILGIRSDKTPGELCHAPFSGL